MGVNYSRDQSVPYYLVQKLNMMLNRLHPTSSCTLPLFKPYIIQVILKVDKENELDNLAI